MNVFLTFAVMFWRSTGKQSRYIHFPIILVCMAITCRAIVYMFGS